ncbi:hypothetical protein C8R46DRAFT_508820 [Mycena filopes]|nr:hypothetical protein C8R46DRAFT_508820 [Mycena filopes]
MHSERRPPRKYRTVRPSSAPEKIAHPLIAAAMQSLQEDEPQEPLNIDLASLPPPFNLYPPHNSTSNTPDIGSDWATFITAYACGRWDPLRTPRPPARSTYETPQEPTVPVPKGALAFDRARLPPPSPSHRLRMSFSAISSATSTPGATPSTYPPFTLSGSYPFPSSSNYSSSSPSGSTPTAAGAAATHLSAQTSAATLRWAGARVRVAPLSLPSPEHELVDPMRGAAAVPIPGSHPEFPAPHSHVTTPDTGGHARAPYNHYSGHWQTQGAQTPGWDVMTPGGTRRSRLSGFWSGTANVEEQGYAYFGGHVELLPTIDASPATPELERGVPASVPIPIPVTMSAPGSVPQTADEGRVPIVPSPPAPTTTRDSSYARGT